MRADVVARRNKTFKQYPIVFSDLKSDTTDNGRFYTTPEGNVYPSVTTVLGRHYGSAWYDEWVARVGKEEADRIGRVATLRGTNVHTITENYVLNDEQFCSGHNPIAVMSFMSIQKFLDDNLNRVYATESAVYSDVLKSAGRFDLFGKWRVKPTIIDIKTTSKEKREKWIESYFVQATTYAIMIEERLQSETPFIHDLAIVIGSSETEGQLFERKTADFRGLVYDIFKKDAENR